VQPVSGDGQGQDRSCRDLLSKLRSPSGDEGQLTSAREFVEWLLEDNYIVGETIFQEQWTGIEMTGNTFIGPVDGVDPLDFRIDYEGRHIGRWRFRQEYLWSNPTSTWRDAEDALADRRMITLRAIWNF